jgi:hypothetical protein
MYKSNQKCLQHKRPPLAGLLTVAQHRRRRRWGALGVVGVDTSSSSSSSSSSTLTGIRIGAATLASSRSAVSSPNLPTLSSSTSCSWFGSLVAVTVASWLNT